MTDLEILHEMIKDTAKVSLTDNYEKKQVILTEPQHDYSVTISGMPEDAIVIKADAFKSPDTIFAGTKNECRRADFIIVADTGSKKVILCIEIKAKTDSKKEITQQLTGTQCFVAYCREIGRSFWNQRNFLDDYAYRFISIGHTGSINKRKTRIDRQSSSHDRPDKMMKIHWPNHRLEFNHLAGR
jgi:hypothetical protein